MDALYRRAFLACLGEEIEEPSRQKLRISLAGLHGLAPALSDHCMILQRASRGWGES